MGKKILVVDDDAMNLRMAEFILQKDGYEVCRAESGMECLIFLQNETPDLILLDVEMPVMNGVKTLEVIKDNDGMSDIPVIFLTASEEKSVTTEAERLGAAGYVTKPFLPQDLLEKVKNILSEES